MPLKLRPLNERSDVGFSLVPSLGMINQEERGRQVELKTAEIANNRTNKAVLPEPFYSG